MLTQTETKTTQKNNHKENRTAEPVKSKGNQMTFFLAGPKMECAILVYEVFR